MLGCSGCGCSGHDERVVLPFLPPEHGYSGWRFHVEAALVAGAHRPDLVRTWLRDVASTYVAADSLPSDCPPLMMALDAKLFNGILSALSGRRAGPVEARIELESGSTLRPHPLLKPICWFC